MSASEFSLLRGGPLFQISRTVGLVRESQSRPEAGLVEFQHTAYNQRGEEVATCRRMALMRRRAAAGS